MQRVIVQIPMSKELRDQAQAVAQDYGFSSLQEIVRVLVTKLAHKDLGIHIDENVEYLTPKEDRILNEKYKRFLKEEKMGKTFIAHSVEEMIEELES